MRVPDASSFFFSVYAEDESPAGCFSRNEQANQCRVNNAFDLLKHTLAYPLQPVKAALWFLASQVLLAVSEVFYFLSLCTEGEAKDSWRTCFSITSSLSGRFLIYSGYNLTCLVFKIAITAGLAIGLAFPEVGRKARLLEKNYELFIEHLADKVMGELPDFAMEEESFKSVEDALAVMELEANSSWDQVKTQYKKLALKYHPDKNPTNQKEAEDMFKNIGEAYRYLAKHKAELSGPSGEIEAPDACEGAPGIQTNTSHLHTANIRQMAINLFSRVSGRGNNTLAIRQ